MKLKIIGKQIYEDHEEKVEQELENARIELKDVCKLEYKSGKIIFDKENNIIEIHNDNNIIIELNKERKMNYITPYGNIILKTYGEKMLLQEEPFKISIEYKIFLNETTKYKNVLEIVAI